MLKAYVEWGLDFVDHFKGMFAVALVERDSGRVVLARDRLGIKPLYYSEGPNRIRFASTLPGLLAGGDVDTDIDPVALYHYLTFHSVVPAPRTILRGVKKLPPATIRVVEPDGSVRDHVYWRPDFVRSDEYAGWDEKDWTDAVHESLTTAVQRRMVSDVPVGVLLSGGLDSSLIVALLALNGQKGLSTFSIGFESVGGREGDEFQYSDLIAERFETDHHKLQIPASDLLPPLEAAVAAMSEPMVSHDCVAFWLLCAGGREAPEGGPVRSGRRRGVRRLPLVPAARRASPGPGACPSTPTRSSTATRRTCGRCSATSTSSRATRRPRSSASTSGCRAPRRRWTPGCGWTRS